MFIIISMFNKSLHWAGNQVRASGNNLQLLNRLVNVYPIKIIFGAIFNK